MKVLNVIKDLIEFGTVDKPLYIVLYARDKEGNIVSKTRFPVDSVFSHKEHEATINIDYGKREDITYE